MKQLMRRWCRKLRLGLAASAKLAQNNSLKLVIAAALIAGTVRAQWSGCSYEGDNNWYAYQSQSWFSAFWQGVWNDIVHPTPGDAAAKAADAEQMKPQKGPVLVTANANGDQVPLRQAGDYQK